MISFNLENIYYIINIFKFCKFSLDINKNIIKIIYYNN